MKFVLAAGALAILAGTATPTFADTYSRWRDIRRDRADIHRDYRQLQQDRRERNEDWRDESQALAHGNVQAAARYDDMRRHEQAEINAVRRDIARDRSDLYHDDRWKRKADFCEDGIPQRA
jgi:hypothetical protein